MPKKVKIYTKLSFRDGRGPDNLHAAHPLRLGGERPGTQGWARATGAIMGGTVQEARRGRRGPSGSRALTSRPPLPDPRPPPASLLVTGGGEGTGRPPTPEGRGGGARRGLFRYSISAATLRARRPRIGQPGTRGRGGRWRGGVAGPGPSDRGGTGSPRRTPHGTAGGGRRRWRRGSTSTSTPPPSRGRCARPDPGGRRGGPRDLGRPLDVESPRAVPARPDPGRLGPSPAPVGSEWRPAGPRGAPLPSRR